MDSALQKVMIVSSCYLFVPPCFLIPDCRLNRYYFEMSLEVCMWTYNSTELPTSAELCFGPYHYPSTCTLLFKGTWRGPTDKCKASFVSFIEDTSEYPPPPPEYPFYHTVRAPNRYNLMVKNTEFPGGLARGNLVRLWPAPDLEAPPEAPTPAPAPAHVPAPAPKVARKSWWYSNADAALQPKVATKSEPEASVDLKEVNSDLLSNKGWLSYFFGG